jgi:putative oxidoreductase
MWSSLKNYSDAALLFLRITLGGLFIRLHGWPMLAGGVSRWKSDGGAMRHLGITFLPVLWGFVAAFSESVGCFLCVIGLFFRPSALMLVLTLLVASIHDFAKPHGSLMEASHAIELMLVFFTLMFVGPGRFSVDKG